MNSGKVCLSAGRSCRDDRRGNSEAKTVARAQAGSPSDIAGLKHSQKGRGRVDHHDGQMTINNVPSLRVNCCHKDQILSILLDSQQSLMGVAGFSAHPLSALAVPAPFIQVPMAPIEEGAIYEFWTTNERVRYEKYGALHCAYTASYLFGCLTIEEARGANLALVTENAYELLFRHIEQAGFRHLLRIWHYIPLINEDMDGLDRYQAFNMGRFRAFSAYRKDVRAAPAASALGTKGGPLTLYFLAGHSPGLPLENRRQVSAYNYPERYGTFSPVFSRAMNYRGQLFISGTASIVGHLSLHEGDVREQTRETIANLSALLKHAGNDTPLSQDLQLKAYLRHSEHLPIVREALAEAFGTQTPVVFLEADICRRELLLEIEGTGKAPRMILPGGT